MPTTLAKHGTNGGYKAELSVGQEPCDRCRKARRVYNSQYSKSAKAKGIKYTSDMVIDHLYQGGRIPGRHRTGPGPDPTVTTVPDRTQTAGDGSPGPAVTGQSPDPAPSLSDRLSAGIRNLVIPPQENPYTEVINDVESLHEIDDTDPEPMGDEWSTVADAEFVLNAAGMAKIQENLGTYLSIVGMTVDMIDPYCGPIIAQQIPVMVERWSKVIAHYPAAAKLFLDSKGGIIMTWISALQSTWPILMALYHHHLAKDIKVENGILYRKNADGQESVPDATMPPFVYSAT